MRCTTLVALAAAVVLGGAWQQATPAKPAAPAAQAAPAKLPPGLYATFDTASGKFVVELYAKDAPLTVQNFVDLATGKKHYHDPITNTIMANKFYDGLLFFRTEPGTLIQTGDVLNNGTGKIGITLKPEKNALKFDKPGRMGMAQVENDVNSRSSGIFFMLVPNPQLNSDFVVMGQIVQGMDVALDLSKATRPRLNHVTIQTVQ